MIDLILNSEAGITVAHDEVELENLKALHVKAGTGEAWLELVGGDKKNLASVAPTILENLHSSLKAQAIRMSSEGWSIASVRDIDFHLHA